MKIFPVPPLDARRTPAVSSDCPARLASSSNSWPSRHFTCSPFRPASALINAPAVHLTELSLRIALFVACYNDTLFPQTGIAVTRVLERLGHTVTFPLQQTCCGQMHYNTGYHREAIPLVRRFVELFESEDAVCVPSASCVAMMREHYELIARHENDPILLGKVQSLLPRVFEFSELLVDRLNITDCGATFPHTVTYHPSCHSLRMLHINEQPRQLLRAVRRLQLIDLPNQDQCCGFGGTFAVKNADVSAAMLAEKDACVLQTGAEVVTALDNSCLMQIYGGLHRSGSPVRTLHIAEILASEGASEAGPQ